MKRRATVFTCDSPTCRVERVGGGSDWKEVEGLHGTVQQVDGSGGVDAGDWFACKEEHVLPAIHAVLSHAWSGQDG